MQKSALAHYIAIVHKEKDSDFGVSFPDFPGCITAGSTLQEAREMAQEALQAHIDWMLEDGDLLPAPSTLDAIRAAGHQNDLFLDVSVRLPAQTRPVRVNISIQESLLTQIDAYAAAHHLTRSGTIAMAAETLFQSHPMH